MIETLHDSNIQRTLATAAFGNEPGTWPLPTASTPHQLWLRAVASGGQGRYGSAYGDLAALRRALRRPAVGLAGAQHAGLVAASARLAHAGARVGRSRAGAGRRRSRGSRRRTDRAGGRRAGRRPLRRRGDLVDSRGRGRWRASCRRRTGWRCAGGGWPPSWRWRPATGQPPSAMPRKGRAGAAWSRCVGATPGQKRRGAGRRPVQRRRSLSGPAPSREAALEATGRFGLTPLRWALACLLIDIGSVTVSAQQMRDSPTFGIFVQARCGAPVEPGVPLETRCGRYCLAVLLARDVS